MTSHDLRRKIHVWAMHCNWAVVRMNSEVNMQTYRAWSHPSGHRHYHVLHTAAVRVGLLCSAIALPLSAVGQTAQPVTLHYIQRPPYMMASGDGLVGLTGLPSYLAFKQAQVPVVIKATPFARQLHYVESNSGQDCMIGMFKKPEREVFAKFTKPVYQDQAQVILTSAANASRLSGLTSVVELFNDKRVVLLVKLAYSYGITLDALIARYQPTVIQTADENLLMLKSIKRKVADYMFMAPEEAAVAISAAGYALDDFKQIKPKDMPDGEYRHLMCSKNVPDAVIQKLNAAIKFKK